MRPIASERSEWTGIWWLPWEEPTALGQGTLSYEPEDGLRLRLVGMSETEGAAISSLAFERYAPPRVIHGRLLDGQVCTLLNAFVLDHDAWHPSGGWRALVRANAALVGVHVLAADEFQFAEADFRFRGLRPFLRQPRAGGPTTPVLQPDGDRSIVTLDVDGAKLTFGLAWDREGDDDRQVAEVAASLHVELEEPAPLSAWDELWVRRVHDLVLFATREPTWVESFTATLRHEGRAEAVHPAIRRGASDDVWEIDHVSVVRSPVALRRGERDRRYSYVIFGPDDLGDDFARFVRAWFALQERLGPATAFLVGSLNTPSEYLENRLLNLTAFAEAYHRTLHDEPPLTAEEHAGAKKAMLGFLESHQRAVYGSRLQHSNQQTQRKRFEWLVLRAVSAVSELPEAERLPNHLSDTRNFFAHLGDRGPHVVEGADLAAVVGRLVVVLQANLLLDLGVDESQVGLLLRRSYTAGWP